jgi:3-oxoacyl-[acyl-carrier-protein] synthase II
MSSNKKIREERRVVLTGLGVVSPVGLGLEEFWTGLKEGRNGVGRVTHFDPSGFRSQMAAEVKNFQPEDWIEKKSVARMDRFIHFAMAAGTMAMQDSGLPESPFDGNRAGVIIGSGIGGALTIQDGYAALREIGPKSLGPFFVTKTLINMAACQVSIKYGLKGHLSAPCMACSSSSNAIGDAFRIIQRGDADIMLAGGSEASINPLPYGGFCASRSMSVRNDVMEKASRPFDKNRDGFVMGEGSGIVVLEDLEHARERGARIYAELKGYGNTADAFHTTAPDPRGDGMVRVMQAALEDAGLRPQDVGYINAHGTSTPLNDKIESAAVMKVFGEHSRRLKLSSIKSMVGHLLAAAGAVEMISTAMSVYTGILPPTINYEEHDPDCPLDYVTHGAEKIGLDAALSNSFGFGGGNVCLALKRYRD